MRVCPGRGAARSGAPLIRDRHRLERSRLCSAPLHFIARAALRPGQERRLAIAMKLCSRRLAWNCAVSAVVALSCLMMSPASAEPSFYAGKQITFICGSGVGGGYDLLTRLAARHLGRLIPGHPTVIVQNMPAAGGLAARGARHAGRT